MNSHQCARPACPGKASAWLAYDYQARCAWLRDIGSGEAPAASHWPLCDRHADGLKVPRGWSSVDHRQEHADHRQERGAGRARATGPGRAGRPAAPRTGPGPESAAGPARPAAPPEAAGRKAPAQTALL